MSVIRTISFTDPSEWHQNSTIPTVEETMSESEVFPRNNSGKRIALNEIFDAPAAVFHVRTNPGFDILIRAFNSDGYAYKSGAHKGDVTDGWESSVDKDITISPDRKIGIAVRRTNGQILSASAVADVGLQITYVEESGGYSL